MRAKAVGVTAAFTALASVLNLVKIPAPYLLGYTYQLGDIILVIAFFLFGLKIGFAVATLNMAVTMALNTSLIGIIGAPYYMIAVLTMILGAYIFLKIIKKKSINKRYGDTKSAAYATLFAVITRTLIMLPLDFFIYGFLVAFVSGWSIANSFALITATMPLIILYNVTVPLYVIPISYYIAKRVPKQFSSTLFDKSIV
jgi:riboflavin transporter FmnP